MTRHYDVNLQTLVMMVSVVGMVSSSLVDSIEGTRHCGPAKVCSCSPVDLWNSTHRKHALRMDCSKRNVTLRDVCNSIVSKDLVVLDLSFVKLYTIVSTELFGCKHIERLHIKDCAISKIDDDAFKGMEKLKSIDLSGNALQQFYTGDEPAFLTPLKHLAELRFRILSERFVQDNNVSLSYPDLSGLIELESLHLDGLPNRGFPSTYNSLVNLRNLTLTGASTKFCSLDNLAGDTFENVTNVENLFISRCKVTNVEADTLKVLVRLKRLDISLNRQLGFDPLNNISYGLQFTDIEFLNYSRNYNTFGLGNMITKRDICYLRNTTLKEIALDGLRLELFETNVPLLIPESLNIIHLNDNRFTFGLYLLQMACGRNMTTIDANMQNVAHKPNMYVRELQTSETQCRHNIPTDCPYLNEEYLFNVSKITPNCHYFNDTPDSLLSAALPSKLKTISFSNSKLDYSITSIPIFPLQNRIEDADFSGNIFYRLIGPVGPITSLKYLKMSRNYCAFIGPEFFIYMMELEELHAEKNLLGDLLANPLSADIFKPLSKLRLLNISENQVKDFSPSIFTHLTNLEVLDISYNSIDTWTLDIINLRNLSQLYLRFNSLESLPDSIIDHLTEMLTRRGKKFTIDLTNNPIKYACRNRRFLKWMVENQKSFIGFKHYKFYEDSGTFLTAKEFKHAVQFIDKLCSSYTVSIVLSTVGISVFLTIVISGLVYKNRWKLRYFLYMNKARFRGYRSYEPLDNFKYDAFISYSDENSEFRDEILKILEDDNDIGPKLKLCIHERDFRPGRAITENIIDAIQTSKKTVIVLSRAYLKSKWCMYEFHMTRMESIYSRTGSSIIVIVMLEPVALDDDMPLEMMQWIRHDSYLEYTNDEQGRLVFWNKLREAILE